MLTLSLVACGVNPIQVPIVRESVKVTSAQPEVAGSIKLLPNDPEKVFAPGPNETIAKIRVHLNGKSNIVRDLTFDSTGTYQDFDGYVSNYELWDPKSNRLIKKGTSTSPDLDPKPRRPEHIGFYDVDLSGLEVYVADFGSFKTKIIDLDLRANTSYIRKGAMTNPVSYKLCLTSTIFFE